MVKFIFKSSGQYLGFLENDNIFSWDGKYLGWLEDGFVWDILGQFRGELKEIENNFYILKNVYALSPLPKTRKPNPIPSASIPTPKASVSPVVLEIGWTDGFK